VIVAVAFVEMLYVPPLVRGLVQRLQPEHFIDWRPAVGHLLYSTVQQALQPGLLVAVNVTAECSFTDPQQLSGLLLGQATILPVRIGFFEAHHPYLLLHT